MKSTRLAAAALVVLFTFTASQKAEAALVSFTFFGTAGAGSTLDLGGGAFSVAGMMFTITGTTLSDVDMNPADGVRGLRHYGIIHLRGWHLRSRRNYGHCLFPGLYRYRHYHGVCGAGRLGS